MLRYGDFDTAPLSPHMPRTLEVDQRLDVHAESLPYGVQGQNLRASSVLGLGATWYASTLLTSTSLYPHHTDGVQL